MLNRTAEKKPSLFFKPSTSRTLLCSPYTTTKSQKPTARTPAGRHRGNILQECKKTDCILIDSIFSHVMGRQEYRLARALACCMNRLDDGTTYNTHCIHIPHTTHTTYEHHIQTSRYRRHCRTKRNKHCRIQTSTTTIVSQLCFSYMSVFIHYVLLCCRDR